MPGQACVLLLLLLLLLHLAQGQVLSTVDRSASLPSASPRASAGTASPYTAATCAQALGRACSAACHHAPSSRRCPADRRCGRRGCPGCTPCPFVRLCASAGGRRLAGRGAGCRRRRFGKRCRCRRVKPCLTCCCCCCCCCCCVGEVGGRGAGNRRMEKVKAPHVFCWRQGHASK